MYYWQFEKERLRQTAGQLSNCVSADSAERKQKRRTAGVESDFPCLLRHKDTKKGLCPRSKDIMDRPRSGAVYFHLQLPGKQPDSSRKTAQNDVKGGPPARITQRPNNPTTQTSPIRMLNTPVFRKLPAVQPTGYLFNLTIRGGSARGYSDCLFPSEPLLLDIGRALYLVGGNAGFLA